MKKRPKIEHLIDKVRECVQSGRYLDTYHSQARQFERGVARYEITDVLVHGFHEKAKDTFDDNYQAWNYAIRGKTVDKKELRVIVSFVTDSMLIISVINICD